VCKLHTYTAAIAASRRVRPTTVNRSVEEAALDRPRPAAADPTGLLAATRAVLAPLARLAVARGVPYADFDELVKQVFIDAAREAHASVPIHRAVSRMSAATGISRREVTRLVQPPASEPAPKRLSTANELFARWLSDPQFHLDAGGPRKLPRLGRHPSFESLAHSVNRDVRPRTLLEELCRLGIARIDDSDDTVELLRDTFVPSSDEEQMFGFLGENVGDHLSAAVENVVSRGLRHLEQALFADELSLPSIEHVRPLVGAHWKTLVQALAPVLQQLIDDDRANARPQDHRIRIGMYAFTAPMSGPPEPDSAIPPTPTPL
jgi:hypothetical protein